MKRLFDVVIAAMLFVLLSPAFAVLAIVVKVDSSGSVFYRGLRVGLYGRPFRMFKFRTMVADAERRGGSSTPNDDWRITRVGRTLRRYKLDELPQFLNVLRGEMSLVGPRPEVQQYVDLFTQEERAILTVRPGITDWASLWNPDEGALLAGSPDPERTYLEEIRPQKLRLQLAYVRQQSLMTDLRIIAHTLAAVIFRKPARAVLARVQEQ